MADKWLQEKNIANRIRGFIERQKCVTREFNDNRPEHGYRIVADTDRAVRIVVEVRGGPSGKVSSSGAKGQIKKWFADALLELVIERSIYSVESVKIIAFGLPDLEFYRELVNDISYARRRLALSCYFVKEDESIEEVIPIGK